MPKNKVSDLITDQEIAFARLVLSGTMTDRGAAEAVGLNPDSAAYTKAKPRVRAYITGQVKALSMIVAMQSLIPDRHTGDRLAVSSEKKSVPPHTRPEIYSAAWLREQPGKTIDPQPGPALAREEDEPGLAEAEPTSSSAGDAAPPPGITPSPIFGSSESAFANRFSPSEAAPSSPPAPAFVSAPDTRVPFSIKKNFFARRR
jgi:hypothetical protein